MKGTRCGKGLKLSTDCFTFEDCTRLCLVLYDLYRIKASVNSAGRPGQFCLYLWSETIPFTTVFSETIYSDFHTL